MRFDRVGTSVAAALLLLCDGAVRAEDEAPEDFRDTEEGTAPGQAVERFRVLPVPSRSWGAESPLVTIVQFVDFACRHCAEGIDIASQVASEFVGDVAVSVRLFPLPENRASRPSARAFLDATHRRRSVHATVLNLVKRFMNPSAVSEIEISDDKLSREIAADVQLGLQLGVEGVPTTFVNGRRFGGVRSREVLRAIVTEEMAVARALIGKGVARNALYQELMKDALNKAPRGPRLRKAVSRAANEVRIGDSPIRGAMGASVTLVVFSDYECPYSAELNETVKTLIEDYGGKILVAVKQRPLAGHIHARLAACAALAAQEQGKFWEMHDKLVKNRNALTRADLLRHAAELKLEPDAFRAGLDADRCSREIEKDRLTARAAGVVEVPVSFVNGWRVTGAQPAREFKKLIDAALDKAEKKGAVR